MELEKPPNWIKVDLLCSIRHRIKSLEESASKSISPVTKSLFAGRAKKLEQLYNEIAIEHGDGQ